VYYLAMELAGTGPHARRSRAHIGGGHPTGHPAGRRRP
jgi:hypothetical protein